MKKINNLKFLLSFAVVLGLASCDKGFVEKNQNEYNVTNVDPALLLSSVERNLNAGSFEGEQTIAQQFVNVQNTSATNGFNFNTYQNIFNNGRWTIYGGAIKNLEQVIFLVKDVPARSNLYQMARILRAYNYMVLVDTYGDVPYSEAGQGYLKNIANPKYDDDAAIYADLYTELKAARTTLSTATGADVVPQDILYGGTSASLAVQIPKWKRLAGSLMLRLGMRYSKLDQAKAQTIVADAMTDAGVMTSNADNMYIPFNGLATDINPLFNFYKTNASFYYLAEPFVNQLKGTNDPRSPFIAATYTNPNDVNGPPADTNPANQFGFPVGYDATTRTSAAQSGTGRVLPTFRGAVTGGGIGFRYSQLNYTSFASNTAPVFFCTYAQTQLLLAEAAVRGWVGGGTAQAAIYYNSGIRASMDEFAPSSPAGAGTFPNATGISGGAYATYIAQPSVALTPGTELAKINTQYWVVSLANGHESWANRRRSGFPVLAPNDYNNNLAAASDGFVHRMQYNDQEPALNSANYQAAAAAIGGDKITTRVFWDIP